MGGYQTVGRLTHHQTELVGANRKPSDRRRHNLGLVNWHHGQLHASIYICHTCEPRDLACGDFTYS